MVELIQKSEKTGKNKVIKIWNEGGTIIREFGLEGGKMQRSETICEAKNVGKKSETSAEEQALKEIESIVSRKIREGYSASGGVVATTNTKAFSEKVIDFDNLPTSFCPSKPINDPPKDFTGKVNELKTTTGSVEKDFFKKYSNINFGADYSGERKNNGVNLWRVIRTDGESDTYTRSSRKNNSYNKEHTRNTKIKFNKN